MLFHSNIVAFDLFCFKMFPFFKRHLQVATKMSLFNCQREKTTVFQKSKVTIFTFQYNLILFYKEIVQKCFSFFYLNFIWKSVIRFDLQIAPSGLVDRVCEVDPSDGFDGRR